MKFVEPRPYADPEPLPASCWRSPTRPRLCRTAAPTSSGSTARSCMSTRVRRSNKAGLDLAIAKGWLWLHESGTYVKFTDSGAALFA